MSIEGEDRLRGLIALLLAVYWNKGDGARPPAFIGKATLEANLLTDEQLARHGVKRIVDQEGVHYETL
jgi:hypothetical protein